MDRRTKDERRANREDQPPRRTKERREPGCRGCTKGCSKDVGYILARAYNRSTGKAIPPEFMEELLDIETCSWYKKDVEKNTSSHKPSKEDSMSDTNTNTNDQSTGTCEPQPGFFAKAWATAKEHRGKILATTGLLVGAAGAAVYVKKTGRGCPVAMTDLGE